jgi:hypothetical protein
MFFAILQAPELSSSALEVMLLPTLLALVTPALHVAPTLLNLSALIVFPLANPV